MHCEMGNTSQEEGNIILQIHRSHPRVPKQGHVHRLQLCWSIAEEAKDGRVRRRGSEEFKEGLREDSVKEAEVFVTRTHDSEDGPRRKVRGCILVGALHV